MVPDRQKVWTDGQKDGRTDGMDGRRQNYIPPTLSGIIIESKGARICSILPFVPVILFGILGSYLFFHILENILLKLGK